MKPDFRDDLRQPQVVFGRCAVTGEFGKCVALDLGDISIQTPDTERGVEIDTDGKVTFQNWKPVVFENQITISDEGLKKLLAYTESQDNPIPSLSPELVYIWQVLYKNGSGLRQYRVNSETGNEEEVISSEINWDQVKEISVIPRYDTSLPTYTFVPENGKFYKNGQEIDIMYEGIYNSESHIVYARKVTHSWGSQAIDSLSRNITNNNTSVLQLLGWKTDNGLKAVIGIDERGNWRPFEYI